MGSPHGRPQRWAAQTWEADTLPAELLPPGFTLIHSVCLSGEAILTPRCTLQRSYSVCLTTFRPLKASPSSHGIIDMHVRGKLARAALMTPTPATISHQVQSARPGQGPFRGATSSATALRS